MSDAAALPRTVVVGCGHWGKNLVRNVHGLGALAGIVEERAQIAADFAEKYGVPSLTLAAAIGDPQIAALMIAAPAEAHYDVARRALEAGKHVFVEKPLSLCVADAEALVSLAAERGSTLMVGHLLHYHPGFLRLQEMVRNGDLGRLQYVYSNRLNLGKFRREEDVFWSFAPHDISMILALVGEEPDQVTATGAAYLHQRVADVTTTHLSFPSGVHAHVFVSWLHPFKEQKLVVVGDGGMAVFDDGLPWNEKLKLYPHGVSWKNGMPEPVHADAVDVAIDEEEPLRNECAHFLECVATGAQPRTDGKEGVRVLRVLSQSAAQAGDARRHLPAASGSDGVSGAAPRRRDYFVHESAYVDDGAEIGAGTKIWHFSHVLGGTKIGERCVLGQNVMAGPDVSIGDRCKIQNNVSLYKGVVLEEGVFCGPSCVFTNVLNPRAEVERKDEFRETRVGRGATIGANATIVCGHPIGEYAFIAAGAVITKPVPAYALMAGVPATRIGWMSAAGERLGDDLICPRSGARYELRDDDTLIPIDPAAAGSEAAR